MHLLSVHNKCMEIDVSASVQVSLVYSPQARQVDERVLHLPPGTTAGQAVQSSGILEALSKLDLSVMELGVWGKRVAADYVLQQGDRIELYRPLTVDPKVARRERFARQGARTAGLFAKRRVGAKAGY